MPFHLAKGGCGGGGWGGAKFLSFEVFSPLLLAKAKSIMGAAGRSKILNFRESRLRKIGSREAGIQMKKDEDRFSGKIANGRYYSYLSSWRAGCW